MSKKNRLLIMMFLQYFVQGSWNMVIGAVLAKYGLKSIVGTTYSMLGLATIISPLFMGMIADRFIASQKIMGALHLINGIILFNAPALILHNNISGFLILIFFVGLCFYPTTTLANSISFRHIDGVKTFPIIRVLGTIGFMCAGFTLGYTGFSTSINSFNLAGVASLIMSVYAFFCLPDTPPIGKKEISIREILCLDALSLFKDKNFSIFMLSTFILMISKTAYSAYLPVFLPVLGLEPASLMQIAIGSEVVFMIMLPYLLAKLGFKNIISLGAISWFIRCVILSQAIISDSYLSYILIALLLQGFCWDFFFTAGDIYVDKKASLSIKAQAQSLRFIVSNGFGLLMASTVCGWLNNTIVTEKTLPLAAPQWQTFWLYPAGVGLIIFILFYLLFNDKTVIMEHK